MAAASQRRAGIPLPAMREDGGKRIVRREATEWTEGAGAGWSAGTPDIAIHDKLVLVLISVEFFVSMIEVDGK